MISFNITPIATKYYCLIRAENISIVTFYLVKWKFVLIVLKLMISSPKMTNFCNELTVPIENFHSHTIAELK
jgi:hypothetical protein